MTAHLTTWLPLDVNNVVYVNQYNQWLLPCRQRGAACLRLEHNRGAFDVTRIHCTGTCCGQRSTRAGKHVQQSFWDAVTIYNVSDIHTLKYVGPAV